MRTLISGGTVVGPTGALAAEVLVEDERIVAIAAPGTQLATAFAEGGRVIDASGRLVVPGGDRCPHPHGTALRRHLRLRHLRDGYPRRGVGRYDDDRGLRRPAQGRGSSAGLEAARPRRKATAPSTTAST